jgi:hypothetical protein
MTKPADKPQWVRVAEQFEQSGLTQKQFAQQQGLPLSTVQSWVKWTPFFGPPRYLDFLPTPP